MARTRWVASRRLARATARWAAPVAVAAVLLPAAAFGVRLLDRVGRTPAAVEAALRTERAVHAALTWVATVESERRGYQLTGASEYRTALTLDYARALAALDDVRTAVRPSPAEQAHVDAARTALVHWVDEAMQVYAGGAGASLGMDHAMLGDARAHLRSVLAAARAAERTATAAAADAARRARWLWLLVTGATALVVLGLAHVAARRQRRLERGAQELDLLLGALPFTLLSVDRLGTIRRTSGCEKTLAGLVPTTLAGRPLTDLVTGSDHAAVTAALSEALAGTLAEREVLAQGEGSAPRRLALTLAPVVLDGAVAGVSVVARDVTAERTMRTRIQHAERLASLGALVAGVAHELNNPLGAIVTFAGLIDRARLSAEDRSAADTIGAEARRAAGIVRNLLDFARQRVHRHDATDLGGLIERTVSLRRFELRAAKVALEVDLERNLPPVPGDWQELQQVFLNLLVNAEHAVGERVERRIAIGLRCAGPHRVTVTVDDTGPGVPEDKRQVIFEPFYTSKPQGVGTGLGLPISRGIITEHGGELRVETAPGGGARFVVELPAMNGSTAPRPEATTPPAHHASVPGDARVLLVDDEPANRRSIGRLLQRLGYRVTAVADGREALAAITTEPFAAVLSDVHMPNLDGGALYEEIARTRPALAARMVFMSGDSVGDGIQRRLVEQGCTLVNKPFEIQEIEAILARLVSTEPVGADRQIDHRDLAPAVANRSGRQTANMELSPNVAERLS